MTTSEFVQALAETESDDNPDAPMGDGGRALGRWQMHPDWMDTYSKRFGCFVKLNETWDSWQERIITAFASFYLGMLTPVETAMYFHMGHRVKPTDADWDKAYEARFLEKAKGDQ